ncbi:MAG: hypothetical protein HQ565_07855 [Bacteroidetes bacterium]|nr:hypothetical protein [Bacteroidota bacterium]
MSDGYYNWLIFFGGWLTAIITTWITAYLTNYYITYREKKGEISIICDNLHLYSGLWLDYLRQYATYYLGNLHSINLLKINHDPEIKKLISGDVEGYFNRGDDYLRLVFQTRNDYIKTVYQFLSVHGDDAEIRKMLKKIEWKEKAVYQFYVKEKENEADLDVHKREVQNYIYRQSIEFRKHLDAINNKILNKANP